MRTLYLVRHAQPVKFGDGHACVSRTDIPLSDVGFEQAEELRRWFSDKNVACIFTSPLSRACETAKIVSGGSVPLVIDERLSEVSVGLWEGLSFSEIKERYPDEYAARGENIASYPPPEGESFASAAERMDGAVREILAETEGDILLVSHAGIIRAWYCKASGADINDLFSVPQPYGGISAFSVNGDDITPVFAGDKPSMLPGGRDREQFFGAFSTPYEVRAHCVAVAESAERIAKKSGEKVDTELLRCAALLHDIARAEGREHPRIAAEAIKKAGYTRLAEIIAQHHDLEENAPREAEILYLADTTTEGVKSVSIEERFAVSREKCNTPEAIAAWERRYSAAKAVQNKYIRGAD